MHYLLGARLAGRLFTIQGLGTDTEIISATPSSASRRSRAATGSPTRTDDVNGLVEARPQSWCERAGQ